MAKPIFIATFGHFPEDVVQRNDIISHFEDLKEDYHVFVLFEDWNGESHKSKFQVFSDKEIEPTELERLKELVNSPWT